MAEKASRGSIFSLRRVERGYDPGAGTVVEVPLRYDGTDTILPTPYSTKPLTHAEIGEGVRIPEPESIERYGPYADAWKQFDRLQKDAKGANLFGWAHWAFGGISGIARLLDPHRRLHWLEGTIFVVVVIQGAGQQIWAKIAAAQLEHWPCPRCHSEWPGKKIDKDPKCAVCGLKLHQALP